MRSVELAGAIGIMFVRLKIEFLHGEMGSIAESLDTRNGRNRWRPDGITAATQLSPLGLRKLSLSREWLKVPRDHSRSRHGNQRPY